MGVAAAVVAITRHGLQLDASRSSGIEPVQWPPAWEFTLGAALSAAALAGLVLLVPNPGFRMVMSPLSCGIISGLGLTVSGMTSQCKVLGFLDVGGYWDPSLAFVMGGGLCVAFPTFFFWVDRPNHCPLAEGAKFEAPSKVVGLDSNTAKLVLGASLFGMGWGFCGLCPGPGVVAVLPYLIQGSAGGGLEANLGLGAFFVFLCAAWLGCDVVVRRAAAPTLLVPLLSR
ncbi:unnamed protein product [Polarella glacialis]|uniref:Sulphur transport domain-containing protein n=1 Tax=Polarella glacialis TaxID=89957 RepID=A0A813DU21_POLGL|nr:unnamed protein product [Polarella glacialis]